MKTFTISLLALLCLSSGARVINLKSLNINTSMRVNPFTSFTSLNERSESRARRTRRNPIDLTCVTNPYRTFSGACNNLRNPQWGARDQPFRLIARPVTHDITKLPNARLVSNIVCKEENPIPNRRRMSELVTFFGQFLDHTVTETIVDRNQPWPIEIPANDTTFPKGGTLPFFRSVQIGTGKTRAAENRLSSYIDAVSVYGPDEEAAKILRSMVNGKMKLDSNGFLIKRNGFFLSGDNRVNENPILTALHTLFTREHNKVADEIIKAFPKLNDEEIYQLARKIVGAEMQAIVFYEFIPAMTGRTLPRYEGYDQDEQASISNTFSTVGFRVGHTLINPMVTSISANGVKNPRKLREAFFNPEAFEADGMDNLFRGMIKTQASEVDNGITEDVRDFLISSEGQSDDLQLDLAALNIQRARDHGVPSYNALRTFYGLPPLKTFDQITSNVFLQVKLEEAYDQDISKVDPWVGGISEDQKVGSLGPLFARIWLREFKRLRNGDRFYFENDQFTPEQIQNIPTVEGLVGEKNIIGKVMQHVISRNTGINQVPTNPFFV